MLFSTQAATDEQQLAQLKSAESLAERILLFSGILSKHSLHVWIHFSLRYLAFPSLNDYVSKWVGSGFELACHFVSVYDSHARWCISSLFPCKHKCGNREIKFSQSEWVPWKMIYLAMWLWDKLQACWCLHVRLSFRLCLWGFAMSGVPVNSWLLGKMNFSHSALIPRNTVFFL